MKKAPIWQARRFEYWVLIATVIFSFSLAALTGCATIGGSHVPKNTIEAAKASIPEDPQAT